MDDTGTILSKTLLNLARTKIAISQKVALSAATATRSLLVASGLRCSNPLPMIHCRTDEDCDCLDGSG